MSYQVIPVRISRAGRCTPVVNAESLAVDMPTLADAKLSAGQRTDDNANPSIDAWAVYPATADIFASQPVW